jgi:hypothetical protein
MGKGRVSMKIAISKDVWIGAGMAAMVFVIIGLLVALWMILKKPTDTIIETPQEAIQQTDGSVVLRREATTPKTKPKAVLPKGAVLNRQVEVAVQPTRTVVQDDVGHKLPPVHVDLSLVDMPDRSRRVIASSPDGTVTGGVDIPVLPIEVPKKWAAGLSYGTDKTPGIWVERDMGRFRLGAEVNQTRGLTRGVEARVRIGFTF